MTQPRRSLGFWDLYLYAVAMAFSLRWMATAAAAGPASVVMWALAVVGFMGPLVIATAELTGRFPREGGIYLWTRDTLGPFWGFVTGWLYWTCNLPFFSGLLYFIVNALGVAAGPKAEAALRDPVLFCACVLALAAIVSVAHLRGLGVGKWLGNLGSTATFALLAMLIGVAAILWARTGPATDFVHADWRPPLNADGAALWATMVFAFGGPEALAFLRHEARGGMRQILRVLALVGATAVAAYIAGTVTILAITPPAAATRLGGVPDAISLGLGRIGLGALAPAALIFLAASLLGGYSAWFGVAARLPMAVGVDRYLPAGFGRQDAKTGAPTWAILAQSAAVVVLVMLGQAGASVKAAYDFLVSMSVLSYTLPFVFMFIVYWRVQSRAAPAGAWTVGGPGNGGGRARAIALVGLVVTLSAIACTAVPSPDATDKAGAVIKLFVASGLLIAAGVALYVARRSAAVVPS